MPKSFEYAVRVNCSQCENTLTHFFFDKQLIGQTEQGLVDYAVRDKGWKFSPVVGWFCPDCQEVSEPLRVRECRDCGHLVWVAPSSLKAAKDFLCIPCAGKLSADIIVEPLTRKQREEIEAYLAKNR